MIIIHAMNALTRIIERALHEQLSVMPVVVVTGARQTGKTTLVTTRLKGRRYFSLDDLEVLEMVRREPETLLLPEGPHITLDEVQSDPAILSHVKRAVDESERRVPGRFVLTGSANLLLMRRVAESLAGRAGYLTLWPMTSGELAGEGRAGLWEDLLRTDDENWVDLVSPGGGKAPDWREAVARGGFPVPALELQTRRERAVWFEGYVRTYLERDLRDLAAVTSLVDFRRLLKAASLRLGQSVNQTEVSRDIGVSQPTVHRWLNLLEASYVLVRLPAFSLNRTKRLIKSAKLYWVDTGLALHVSQLEQPTGAHLENLVLCDLLAWRDARAERAEVFYWRTSAGEEVDFVLEAGGKLLPVEVKATARPGLRDCKGILAFRQEYPDLARAGLLVHTGTKVGWLAPGVLEVPWWQVLGA